MVRYSSTALPLILMMASDGVTSSDAPVSNGETPKEDQVSPAQLMNKANFPVIHFRDEEVKFTFKKRKKTDGENEAGVEPERRAPVTLTLPLLTADGLISSMEDEKVLNFVLDVVNDVIRDAARQQVSDEERPVNRQSELDLNKLTIKYIAALPKSERGGGISKETWEEFAKDYVLVMQAVTGKSLDKLEKAAAIFTKRLVPVQSEKPVLHYLREQLSLWASNTSQSEDLLEVFTFLDNKIGTLLEKDSTALLEAL